MSEDSIHPLRLRFQSGAKQLILEYSDDTVREISFETLRVKSPSAEVRGHGGDAPAPVMGKENVGIVAADPVGHYAVRLHFDDGHKSGLFTWGYLKELSAPVSC